MINPYQQYAQSQVYTAPPEELTLLLYKGAVKFITLAIKGIDDKLLQETNNNIIKAQDIYYELLNTLDFNYEISNNLASLYNYIIRLLIKANLGKEKETLEIALGLAKEFAVTWEEAIKVYRRSQKTSEVG